MQSAEYQAQFGRTLAPVFFPRNIHPAYVGRVLRNRAQSARFVDAIKRALYYNKTDRLDGLLEDQLVSNKLGVDFNTPEEVLHAILGMEGETAEITEAALKGDRAKIIDEAGDFLWYLALLFKQHDISFDEVFAANIEKLKARFPDKFSIGLAVNRDLEKEALVFQ